MCYIGNVKIDNRIVLAPMAGICNSAFRRIAREMGAGLVFAEMVSDKAIVYKNKKTIDMLYMSEEERPIAQQIFGSDVNSFVEAAKFIEKTMHPDIIDINMGCPVPKVALSAQAGSALLKDVNKIGEIVRAVVSAVNVPVTVKIRSGWDMNSINAVEVAKICEESGASAITIHPRTRSQGYSGKADWNIIKSVKESVKIPIIGNGDVRSVEDAKRMFEFTSCDMVMIGRGCLGNLWLFKQLDAYFKNGIMLPCATYLDNIDICIKLLEYLLEFKSEHIAVLEIRSHIAWSLKGVKNSSVIKNKIYQCDKVRDIIDLLNLYKNELRNEEKNGF